MNGLGFIWEFSVDHCDVLWVKYEGIEFCLELSATSLRVEFKGVTVVCV